MKCTKCVTCKIEKRADKFYPSQLSFRSPRCKICMRKSIQTYYFKNRKKYLEINRKYVNNFRDESRLRNHKSKLKLKYNMTVDEYNQILISQNNTCAICKLPERIVDKRLNYLKLLCVDHSHETGITRGLLCDLCNRGLGMFFESTINLQNAIDYLKKHTNNT